MQRNKLRSWLIIAVAMVLSGPAVAADAPQKLQGDHVTGYLSGNTVYVDVVPNKPFGDGGVTPFFYGKDGTFVAALVPHALAGTWEVSDSASYCINIPDIGKTFCTDIYKTEDGIEHHSVGLETLIGTVQKIIPRNDAGL